MVGTTSSEAEMSDYVIDGYRLGAIGVLGFVVRGVWCLWFLGCGVWCV